MQTMKKKKDSKPLEAFYETMGLNVSLYSSSLQHTAMNIIRLNNLDDDFRNIQVIESLILKLIDRGFIRLISDKVSINYHMTFLFSRAVRNPSVSAFHHPKEIFQFHNDLAKAFSDPPSFPIHPIMKQEIAKSIEFLSRPQYTPLPSWFSSFPIDHYYVDPQMKPLNVMPLVMERMVDDITHPVQDLSEKIDKLANIKETKLIKLGWWKVVQNSKVPRDDVKKMLEIHKKRSKKITEIAESILQSL
jgi:hypothetical protein